MKVTLLDYGMGNLRSVSKALEHCGAAVTLATTPDELRHAESLVVPGVGAFRDCVQTLERQGLSAAIREHIASGRPYLGICLGMQVLFDSSEEAPGLPGLGILPGAVRRFSPELGLKVPHMGWNQLQKRGDSRLLAGIAEASEVYFVHSYYVPVIEVGSVAVCDYGVPFSAAIERENIYATQFHPEKSQGVGLGILGNFLEISKK